jgi:hypothetical protein
MKANQLYITAIIALAALAFLFELAAPKKFNWKPTYDKNDREPFGSYVFDDVMSSSIDDYQVADKTFYQIWEEDSTVSGKAFLLAENGFDFSKTDIRYLFKLLHNGNQIMICTDWHASVLEDTFHIRIKNTGNRFSSYSKNRRVQRDSIFLVTDTLDYNRAYTVYSFVHASVLHWGVWNEDDPGDTTCFNKNRENMFDSIDTLACDQYANILAMKIPVGKGEIFIVSTPLMFTNFGMLDKQNAAYAFRLLSHMKDRPLVRIEAYGRHTQKASTPLRYLLITPPLRWAIYTTLLLILLFMIFTAKRRQRIIPVVETPPNRTLGFIQLISSLFYSRHDNAEILKTKYSVFCSDIKQKTGIDLSESRQNNNDTARLAEKTGITENQASQLIKEFRLIPYLYDVPDKQMKELMDEMNKIRDLNK